MADTSADFTGTFRELVQVQQCNPCVPKLHVIMTAQSSFDSCGVHEGTFSTKNVSDKSCCDGNGHKPSGIEWERAGAVSGSDHKKGREADGSFAKCCCSFCARATNQDAVSIFMHTRWIDGWVGEWAGVLICRVPSGERQASTCSLVLPVSVLPQITPGSFVFRFSSLCLPCTRWLREAMWRPRRRRWPASVPVPR